MASMSGCHGARRNWRSKYEKPRIERCLHLWENMYPNVTMVQEWCKNKSMCNGINVPKCIDEAILSQSVSFFPKRVEDLCLNVSAMICSSRRGREEGMSARCNAYLDREGDVMGIWVRCDA